MEMLYPEARPVKLDYCLSNFRPAIGDFTDPIVKTATFDHSLEKQYLDFMGYFLWHRACYLLIV
jgi:hypothetical protein